MENNSDIISSKILKTKVSDFWFTVSTIIFCFATFYIAFQTVFEVGIWGTITLSAYIIIAKIFFDTKKIKKNMFIRNISFVCLLLSVLSFSLNSAFIFYKYVICIVLFMIFASTYSENSPDSTNGYMQIFKTIQISISGLFSNLKDAFKSFIPKENGNKSNKTKKLKEVAIGIAVALPLCVISIVLLVLSDDAFSSLLNKLLLNVELSFNFASVVPSLLMSAILFPFVASFSFSIKNSKNKNKDKNLKNKMQKVAPTVVKTIMVLLLAIYFVYLFSQLAYFFSAFKNILPENYRFTYSEYARKGFFETTVLAILNLSVMAFSLIFTTRNGKKVDKTVKILSCIMCGFTALFVVTSISKIAMYVNRYGLTERRFAAAVFDLMLILCIVLFVVHLFAPKVPYAKILIVSCMLVVSLIFFISPAKIIAIYNTEQYLNDNIKTIDIDHLDSLGADAVVQLEKLALKPKKPNDLISYQYQADAKRKLANAFYGKEYVYYNSDENDGEKFKYDSHGTFNLSKYKAVKVFQRNEKMIEEISADLNETEVSLYY
ncbi:MAG: hypothetical protein DBY14_01750 [Escherichia coli]|nr:MAG: hypothetical protein DBY14_01750 [Escherichia coli]